MKRSAVLGLVRGFLLTVLVTATVVAAPDIQTQVDLVREEPAPSSPLVPGPRQVPVESVRLFCFSPAVASTAPDEAVSGLPLSAAAGDTAVTDSPGSAPGSWVLATGRDATSVVAAGTWKPTGSGASVAYDTCGAPQTEAWLVAGGAGAGRREQLRLGNPGVVPTTVDVTMLTATGTLAPVGGRGLVVAPGTVRILDLDAQVTDAQSPVVHVTATAGGVVATVAESWRTGTRARGAETVASTTPPATSHVIPGLLPASRVLLRAAAPGDRPALVTLSVMTVAGELPYDGEPLVVPAGGSAEVVLSGLPPGPLGLRLSSDEPVVAGVLLEDVGTAADDIGWLTAPGEVTALAGAAVPDVDVEADPLLVMSAVSEGTVDITWLDETDVVHTERAELRAGATRYLRMPGVRAVWMTSTTPGISATVVARDIGDRQGRVTATALTSRPVAVTMEVPAPAPAD